MKLIIMQSKGNIITMKFSTDTGTASWRRNGDWR